MNNSVKFFGSNEDLDALHDALTTKRFEECENVYIRASHDAVPVSISFVIATGIASCIKHWLTVRGKRMVTRETHGEKIVIKGDFSVDEIERLLKIPYALDIENDIQRLKIVVMLGGPSAEREVSLRSGAGVVKALRSLGHTVVELDPKTPDWILPPDTEVVCLAPLHGTYGEDGTVQRQLAQLGVLYTGCDSEASRIAFDKVLTKQKCIAAGVPTAKFVVVHSGKAPLPKNLRLPLVVKPVRQGSSVGLQFVERAEDWQNALAEALKYDSEVLVEEKIVGRETTVGILDGVALPIVEARPKVGSYDYKNKYTAGRTEYFCPANFDAATTGKIQAAALGAFHAVGGRDYARVDVIVRANGEPVVLEVNTLPGMTETSLLPKAAAAAGFSYGELCQQMIDLALKRKFAARERKEHKEKMKPISLAVA